MQAHVPHTDRDLALDKPTGNTHINRMHGMGPEWQLGGITATRSGDH